MATMTVMEKIFGSAPFLASNVIMMAEVGSASNGMSLGNDDHDIAGVVIPEVSGILGINQWDHWMHIKDDLDVNFAGLHKFFRMIVANNPNFITWLWLDNYITVTPQFKQIIESRDKFSSQQMVRKFTGYAIGQLKDAMSPSAYTGYKGEEREVQFMKLGYDAKKLAHGLRLLRMIREFTHTYALEIYRQDVEELVKVKRGEADFNAVSEECSDHINYLKNWSTNDLPEKPDFDFANKLLVNITLDWIKAL